jgi:4-hydroxybenzoate polyprenyltransferase
VKTTSFQTQLWAPRLKLFLALSRTPHALLDLAAPSLGAILCLGAFPSSEVLVLGLITAFSGYTAVYALNDVTDYRIDEEKIQSSGFFGSKTDLDSVFVRHPLAQGMLSYRQGVFWTVAWASLAVAGSFLLNPICIVIFLLASLLEVVYCYLLKITHWRGLISGAVKTSGPLAAVFALAPDPTLSFLVVLFLWLFFWEIGGQNVPNDWADLDADRKLEARTLPVHFGPRGSIRIILSSLGIASAMSLVMFWVSPRALGFSYLPGALFSGLYFLLLPGYRLYQSKASGEAFHLFNRASYYPLAMFLVTLLSWAV